MPQRGPVGALGSHAADQVRGRRVGMNERGATFVHHAADVGRGLQNVQQRRHAVNDAARALQTAQRRERNVPVFGAQFGGKRPIAPASRHKARRGASTWRNPLSRACSDRFGAAHLRRMVEIKHRLFVAVGGGDVRRFLGIAHRNAWRLSSNYTANCDKRKQATKCAKNTPRGTKRTKRLFGKSKTMEVSSSTFCSRRYSLCPSVCSWRTWWPVFGSANFRSIQRPGAPIPSRRTNDWRPPPSLHRARARCARHTNRAPGRRSGRRRRRFVESGRRNFSSRPASVCENGRQLSGLVRFDVFSGRAAAAFHRFADGGGVYLAAHDFQISLRIQQFARVFTQIGRAFFFPVPTARAKPRKLARSTKRCRPSRGSPPRPAISQPEHNPMANVAPPPLRARKSSSASKVSSRIVAKVASSVSPWLSPRPAKSKRNEFQPNAPKWRAARVNIWCGPVR